MHYIQSRRKKPMVISRNAEKHITIYISVIDKNSQQMRNRRAFSQPDEKHVYKLIVLEY